MGKYWIAILMLFVLVTVLIIALFGSDNPCSEFTDTSQRANCFASLGDVSYCAEESYYFDRCLDNDVNREASVSDVEKVCNSIIDTSRREDCFEYLEENY